MNIVLKENVIFSAFNDEQELKKMVLKFIFNAKSDKILYKGNPTQIDYKLLKKILPLDKIKYHHNKNSINNFVDIGEKNIREVYSDFLEKINTNYCLIYKI